MSKLSRKLYVCDGDNIVQGPFDAEELTMLYASGKFSPTAQVNYSGEWEPLAPVAEVIRNHLTQAAALRFMQEESAREPLAATRRGLSLFDLALIGGLWWWFYKVEWPAIAGLAFAVTAWTFGQIIAMVSEGFLKLLGQYIQGFGGMVGMPAVLWLAWTLVSKLVGW